MDEEWLEMELNSGRSIESIAREVGLDPSTVSYYVKKYGLRSAHADRHAFKGGIPREVLEAMVGQGLTIQAMSESIGRGYSTVRYWLRKYELTTSRHREILEHTAAQDVVTRTCRTHGLTAFVRTGADRRYRCKLCRTAHVSERRRRVKQILVQEAGGCCQRCGYSRYIGALQFHHRDPAEKSFSLSGEGMARSIEKARAEARKCDLYCANCHAEVEAGLASITDA